MKTNCWMKRGVFLGMLIGIGSVSAQEAFPVQHIVLEETVWLDKAGGPSCTIAIDMAFFAEETGERDRVDALQVKGDIRSGFRKGNGKGVEAVYVNVNEAIKEPMQFSMINRAVAQMALEQEPDKTSFPAAVVLYRDAMVDVYREEAGKVAEEYPDAASLDYEYRISGTVVDTGAMYVTYRIEKSVFTGGAHPNTTVNYLNFSVDGIVGLREAFGADYGKKMEKLLIDKLMEQEGVKKKEQLAEKAYFLDRFFISGNFYYRDGSFVFVYNPSEIAAYSNGVVEIALPLSLLRKNGLW